MKNISIIGSTGSIGTQALDIVRANGDLNVVALSCGKNVELIEKQAREFKPNIISVSEEADADDLKLKLSDMDIKIVHGMDGLIQVATEPSAEMVLTAIVGMIGVEPTLAAIEAGKDIALANKETLVTAGHLVMKAAKEKGIKILPVDSEHSAIFQSLQGNRTVFNGVDYLADSDSGDITTGDITSGNITSEAITSGNIISDGDKIISGNKYPENRISRILLTASGGPFRGRTRQELENVTVEQALKHPNWSMGPKITIDSASMVNKGLEVIEAHWLFDTELEDIEVLIQPQSIIHSAVEYEDGAIIAQLGTPDMKLPIQYAFYYPERRYLAGERLDFTKISGIEIAKPDFDTFRGIPLAKKACKIGGTMPTVMNEANEVAVAAFLAGKIKFLEIYDMIEYAMSEHKVVADAKLSEILQARDWTVEVLKRRFNIS